MCHYYKIFSKQNPKAGKNLQKSEVFARFRIPRRDEIEDWLRRMRSIDKYRIFDFNGTK